MIAKSLIFLVLLALAGIGVATGSECDKEGMATLRTVAAVNLGDQGFGGRDGRVGALELKAIQG